MSACEAPATCTAFASAVLGVAPYIVANKLKNIQDIKQYGKDKVVSCCVLENAVSPTTIGCTRRCTLSLRGYEEKLLRETLTSVSEMHTGNGPILGVQADTDDKKGDVVVDEEVREPHKTYVELTYIPCGGCEAYRSVFSPETDAAIASSRTVMTVAAVSSSVNRCYVAVETTVTFAHAASIENVDEATIMAHRTAEREVFAFWRQYVDALVYSIEATVLAESYPILSSTVDREFRQSYEKTEDVFCQWAAASGATLPREEVLNHMEAALLSWSRVLREYRHAKLSAEVAKGDIAGTRRIAAETARQLADRTATMVGLQQQLNYLQDTDARHQEFVSMADTVTAMRQTLENQQRARQLLLDKHKREYSSQPGVASKVGGNEADSLCVPGDAASPPTHHPPALDPSSNGNARRNKGSDCYAPKAVPFNKAMFAELFLPDGSLNDNQANEIFHALLRLPTESSGPASVASGEARRRGEYVTADGVKAVLLSMDHLGLYEDIDGTQEQLARWRAAVQSSFASRYGSAGGSGDGSSRASGGGSRFPADAAAAPRGERQAAAAGKDATSPTNALAKLVARHDSTKEEMKLAAMGKLADDTIARYAFRDSGKLYFDEFCLALMHLFN